MRIPKTLGGQVPFDPLAPTGLLGAKPANVAPLPVQSGGPMEAAMRAFGQAAYPATFPKMPGMGGDALAMASSGAPTMDVRDVAPGTYPPPAAPAMPEPVPIAKVDGQGRLKTRLREMYRGVPGEGAEDLAKRIQALNDLDGKIGQLGPITPDEADAIANSWYESVMGPQTPYAEFSPEAQRSIEDAYGGTVPQARMAGAGDVDPQEAAAVAAFTLVNALTGKGSFGDVLKGAGMVLGRAQQKVDLQTQAAQAQDAMRRQGAVARFKRVMEIDDFNNEQKGYAAKRKGDALASLDTQSAIGDRQDAAALAREKAAARADIRKAIMDKDPDRVAVLVDLYESDYGDDLPESIRALSPTYAQKKTIAGTANTEAGTRLTAEKTRGAKIDNDLDEQAFDADLKGRVAKGEITQEQLKGLRLENGHLPEKYRLDDMKVRAGIVAVQNRARAALLRASRPPASRGSTTDDAKAVKGRLDGLKRIADTQNTRLDNLSSRYNQWVDEVRHFEDAIDKESQYQKPDQRRIADLRKQLSIALDARNEFVREMKDARDRIERAAGDIERIVRGDK